MPTRGRAGQQPVRPFAAAASWNTAIPGGCTFTSPGELAGLHAGIDALDDGMTWSIPFHVARGSDPLRPLLYNSLAWSKVAAGDWLRSGNGVETERAILSSSSAIFPFDGNVFSSTSTTGWVLPPSFNTTRSPGSGPAGFHFGPGTGPANGPDGHMAVLQPDGKVLETYATIMLSSGQVVALSRSITDPSSLGDGWQNGQTASMLPAYAGLVDEVELETAIPHAMAVTLPARLLAAAIRYPAYAFDRDAVTSGHPYSGCIPMGARLALPASVDIASLGLATAQGAVIARAAQRYGFIVVDRGGEGITLRMRPSDLQRRASFQHWQSALRGDLRQVFGRVQQAVFKPTAETHGGR